MKISDIEVNNIRFGKLEDNLRTPSQKIAFISYERDRTPLLRHYAGVHNGDLRHSARGTLLPDRSVESILQDALLPRIQEARWRDRLRGD
ncbi:MAG: hypothetical protein ACKPKO_53910, partial [Candidatus Fonsibacter sp.]